MSQVSSRAATALSQAERADADKLAPYEYTKASEYYRKAREEGGEGSFQVAIEYGRRSEEMAVKARELARGKATAPGPTAAPGSGKAEPAP